MPADNRSIAKRPLAPLGTLLLAVGLLAGCASSRDPASPSQELRARIAAGDLAGADALIAERPSTLDARRALDVSIRAGETRAVQHFLARTGADAALDPDGTTPLIRAVLDAPPTSRASIVSVLVQAGARPELSDRYGRDARAYATTRNRTELLALLDGSAGRAAATRPPAFAPWFAADPASPRVAIAVVGPGIAAAATAGGTGSSARAAAGAAPSADPAITPRAIAALLRQSPWRPTATRDRPAVAEVAALRFHADGAADLLRHVSGSDRFEPMPGAFVAWRIDADRLKLAIAGEAFSAVCVGPVPGAGATPSAGVASGPSRAARPGAGMAATATPVGAAPTARASTPARTDALALSCEDRQPSSAARAGGWSLDLARALLLELDAEPLAESSGAALLALATGRGATGAVSTADTRPAERTGLAVSLQGSSAGAACRPGKGRPRASAPRPGLRGDWHAFDTRRFVAASAMAGRMCPQTVARDAALAACRAAGARDAAACISVGGCPAGQASALAAMPGVDAGWLACDADPPNARRKALAACRADLGCDCQLVALSSRNVNTIAGADAACTAPAARRH